MDFSQFWDAGGAAIVLGGTLLATVLASGRREMVAALGSIGQLGQKRFDYEKTRAEIAYDVEIMRHDGVLRGRTVHTSDSEIALVTDALIHDRSIRSLITAHEGFQQRRVRSREAALTPIRHAAEMAPVFGMAGTLFSLSQMRLGEAADMQLLASIAMAILTTLYGLLLAHLVFNPLAQLLERRMLAEESDRQRLINWLAIQLRESCPPSPVQMEKAG
ncbi:hypothetical protein CP97_04665 [Aurantiacibacter atlanticus]|uniref:MotA/TolQ/ExbB proton channel domain-containing protein n=1 Tax=Aurantiacibacter atlanticus TaxID=1648404 RepID=A0A0H4VEE1_9SPHN|nr:MotA/TolQ/ExbB proton channel family protein [Aurantiacibacter atlanticus]AKQ41474.1 hypothetical protein CP97_04665 [Aurantiacibacter atlanticus]